MRDIFDKHRPLEERRRELFGEVGDLPFALTIEQLLSPTRAVAGGREILLFGTNNYLGLTFDPAAIEAGVRALREWGTGTTGSRIANGTYLPHRRLEEAFAQFLGRRSAIVFTTGYQANLATISGLAGPRDVILVDADSHASIYDGCRLSGATVIRFRHNDPQDLDRRLSRLGEVEGSVLVVVEGLYSMLGDVAPLSELCAVVRRHGAFLLVDEAHSFGVYGKNGRGLAEAQGVERDVHFVAGTFSKSLGAVGGFAASDHPRFELLRIAARPYMFTASPNPATMASVLVILERIAAEPQLRSRLWANAEQLHAGLRELGFTLGADLSPVIAVVLPDEHTAVRAWRRLLAEGVYVNLALPPGTPGRRSLLRASVSAAHEPEEVEAALLAFARIKRELDLVPARA